jgi:hypothetical protein
MFETFDNAEIPLPKALAENGERLWTYAHLNLNTPWFYFQYQVVSEESTFNAVLLFSLLDQLKSLINEPDVIVKNAYVVTPGYVNKSDLWQMDLLNEIRTGLAVQERVTIYELRDGRKYYYPNQICIDENQLHNREVVFSANQVI